MAIVDDHEVISLALGALITKHDGLDFVGYEASVPGLIAKGLRADLVVLDLNLRDGSRPIENVERLQAWGAKVVTLTAGENPYLIREVLRTDTLGIILKSAPIDDILDAILRAANAEVVVSTEWAAAMDSDPDVTTAPLTLREREVLALYASGLGAKAVANLLSISENTVDDHIRRIRSVYRRLGRAANSKVDLYRRGIEDGYLPLPTE